MATKMTMKRGGVDTYMELIQRFPLKPIRSDAAHEQAVEVVGELLGRELDAGAGDYLNNLARSV